MATISKSGLLKAKKAGKTTITMKYKDVTARFVLTVSKSSSTSSSAKTVSVSAKGASISNNKMTLKVSDGAQLTVKYGGKSVSAAKATYSSSNKKVATVSKKGYVTAKKEGKATITVKYSGKSKKITVTVTKKTTSSSKPSTSTTATTSKPTTQTCSHNWVAQYKTVSVPAVTKQVQVEVPGTYLYTEYKCSCGRIFKSAAEWETHDMEIMLSTGMGHSCAPGKGVYSASTYRTETQVVTPATTKQQLTGYKCSKCGATK